MTPINGLKMREISMRGGPSRPLCEGCWLELRHLGGFGVDEGQGGVLAQGLNRMELALGWNQGGWKRSPLRAGEVQPGAERGLACGHGADGAGEVGERVVFQHITGRAGLDHGLHKLSGVVDGQCEHFH